MRDSLSSIFSYLFMTTIFMLILSAFGMLIVFLRSFFTDIGDMETRVGFLFVYILIICIILAPIFLYVSNKLEKYGGRIDQI